MVRRLSQGSRTEGRVLCRNPSVCGCKGEGRSSVVQLFMLPCLAVYLESDFRCGLVGGASPADNISEAATGHRNQSRTSSQGQRHGLRGFHGNVPSSDTFFRIAVWMCFRFGGQSLGFASQSLGSRPSRKDATDASAPQLSQLEAFSCRSSAALESLA